MVDGVRLLAWTMLVFFRWFFMFRRGIAMDVVFRSSLSMAEGFREDFLLCFSFLLAPWKQVDYLK